MRRNMKYVVAVALLAVLAVVFGLAGMSAPMSESVSPQRSSSSSSSSSDSVTHFANPPTYDSGWVDIRDKAGQYILIRHGLNTTDVVVDITGKQSLEPMGGILEWSEKLDPSYGGHDGAYSLVQTFDGGYAIAGTANADIYGMFGDFWLVKTDASGNMVWNKTYGSGEANCVIQTSYGGYAIAGRDEGDCWLVETDSAGNIQWDRTYGGRGYVERAYSLVQTFDGGYAIAGYTFSSSPSFDYWLVKTDVETGLAMTSQTSSTISLYRGSTDPYWNYVRVRIWLIKEPTWIYGDINQDGVVDIQDLYILSQNYGKTLSLLSLTGIAFIAGIHTYKKRKQPKLTNKKHSSTQPLEPLWQAFQEEKTN